MSLRDIQLRLEVLLRDGGCERYTARQALADAAQCWREIREDDIAHGGSGEKPFGNFVATEGVAVFALYSAAVEFYVIRGDEADFRRHVDQLSTNEVEAMRAVLAEHFNRPAPDLIIEPPLSRAWLFSSGGGPAAG
jgi:hypothetical protein